MSSRKRAFSASTTTLLHPHSGQCVGMEEYEYEYYSPGRYCTPHTATPCTCAYLHENLPQWSTDCNPATYVVDPYGRAYYLSDFECRLQLPPNTSSVETEITYHYYDAGNEQGCLVDDDEEEENLSPRKRERFEYDTDVEQECGVPVPVPVVVPVRAPITVPVQMQMPVNEVEEVNTVESANPSGTVYRAEQGYLVEEPSEESNRNQRTK